MPNSLQEQSLAAALEFLRRRERALVSRRLHDDVGPTLCAVGLHLGLLRSSLQDNPAAAETLSTIESALAQAIGAVRGLSYRCDPGIVRRCGLRAAFQYLCQDAGARFEDRTPARDEFLFPAEVAEVLFRFAHELLLDAAEAAPGQTVSLRLQQDGFVLHISESPDEGSFPSAGTLELLRLSLLIGLIRWERRQQSGEWVVSAAMRGAKA